MAVQNPPTSNVAAAGGAEAGAACRRPNPSRCRVRLRQDRRWPRRGGGIGLPRHPDRLRQKETMVPSRIRPAGAAVEVGAGVAARDRGLLQVRVAG